VNESLFYEEGCQWKFICVRAKNNTYHTSTQNERIYIRGQVQRDKKSSKTTVHAIRQGMSTRSEIIKSTVHEISR
jgi:hypothetical protein